MVECSRGQSSRGAGDSLPPPLLKRARARPLGGFRSCGAAILLPQNKRRFVSEKSLCFLLQEKGQRKLPFSFYKNHAKGNAFGHHSILLRIELARTVVLVSPLRGLWLMPKLPPKACLRQLLCSPRQKKKKLVLEFGAKIAEGLGMNLANAGLGESEILGNFA